MRVYDLRMLRPRTSLSHLVAPPPSWTHCYVPAHLARAPFTGPSTPWARRPTCTVTGLCYSHSGRRLAASYAHEDIYVFE